MWSIHEVCEVAARALRERADALDAEHSPYGLDALGEVEMQDALSRAFRAHGWGVIREARYPAVSGRPRRSEGERCDVVITMLPDEPLLDPLLEGTLFAGQGVAPEDALWMEIKLARQFAIVQGVAGPNPAYSGEVLTRATSDVRKLSREPGAGVRAAMLVMLTRDALTAEHDALAWAHRCLDEALPIGSPVREGFALTERIGNAWCEVVVMPAQAERA